MIALTADIDWAPEEVIEEFKRLLESHNIKCTLFCTHKSEAINSLNPDLFELGIHPNFNPILEGKGGNINEVIDELMKMYPNAKGIRSHSLLQSSALLNLFAKKGFQYESNEFVPYAKNVTPSLLWNGLVRLPFIWEDDIHWMYSKKFDDLDVDLASPGLKIFNFHPVHVFLNTTDGNHYEQAKQFYQHPAELRKFRNSGSKKGVYDALSTLINEITSQGLTTYKLSEIKINQHYDNSGIQSN
jgi:hypothetical protein